MKTKRAQTTLPNSTHVRKQATCVRVRAQNAGRAGLLWKLAQEGLWCEHASARGWETVLHCGHGFLSLYPSNGPLGTWHWTPGGNRQGNRPWLTPNDTVFPQGFCTWSPPTEEDFLTGVYLWVKQEEGDATLLRPFFNPLLQGICHQLRINRRDSRGASL